MDVSEAKAVWTETLTAEGSEETLRHHVLTVNIHITIHVKYVCARLKASE